MSKNFCFKCGNEYEISSGGHICPLPTVTTTANYVEIPEPVCFKCVELKKFQDRIEKVIKYCKPHAQKMWAASIIGMLKDMDFRDTREWMKDE